MVILVISFHSSFVAKAIFDAINVQTPNFRYYIGIFVLVFPRFHLTPFSGSDSSAAPVTAMGPQFVQDFFIQKVTHGDGWPQKLALKMMSLDTAQSQGEKDD